MGAGPLLARGFSSGSRPGCTNASRWKEDTRGTQGEGAQAACVCALMHARA